MYRIKQRDGDVIKICEELAESLLERGVTGMGLTSEWAVPASSLSNQ